MEEWLERQSALLKATDSGFESSPWRQDFSSKNFHYKTNIEGMWWHDDVLNHYIRNCLTISSIMMDVWNSHGSGECQNNTLKWEVVQTSMAKKPRLIIFIIFNSE